ncbi:unnamed protein product [Arctia plantaginis]|uniref:Peptidase S1 domain-containing protein n=1 Tax=Arctia plantaginis TaxID=874455 RepID=A0A8S0ZJJ6_ARCPL|nr:unnamed protein product [Arctia plantaginis]
MLCVAFILIAIINCGAREIQNETETEEFSISAVAIESLPPGAVTRIIGGATTAIENFPFTVQVLYNRQLVCGGSLLTKRHVLSAAHCFVDINTGGPLSSSRFSIRAGSTFLNVGGTVHSIATIIVHQGYNHTTFDNDVAVVVLSSSVKLSDSVQKARIPLQEDSLADDTTVVAVGWGRIMVEVPGVSNVLNEVTIRTINRGICRQRYAVLGSQLNIPMVVTENMICAGLLDIGGADTCQGDSGGPLMYKGVVVGVTSWGASCAHPQFPGVYARVSMYSTWINQTVARYNGSARNQAMSLSLLVPLIFVMLSIQLVS